MPSERSSPGLWRRLCSTKLSSHAPSTTFFHQLVSGLIPPVKNGTMAVPVAVLGAERREAGAWWIPFPSWLWYCIQCSACIWLAKTWSHDYLSYKAVWEISRFYSGKSCVQMNTGNVITSEEGEKTIWGQQSTLVATVTLNKSLQLLLIHL